MYQPNDPYRRLEQRPEDLADFMRMLDDTDDLTAAAVESAERARRVDAALRAARRAQPELDAEIPGEVDVPPWTLGQVVALVAVIAITVVVFVVALVKA